LPAKGFQNIYILNGLNGNPDWRGLAVVGAVNSIPGAAFPAITDPNNINNPNVNYSVGDVFGESYHTLISNEMPAHSHTLNDPGHAHAINFNIWEQFKPGNGNVTPTATGGTNAQTYGLPVGTAAAITGVTINSTGGSLAHNNVQPSTAAIWIAAIY
jgi:microcystin-dependent protein